MAAPVHPETPGSAGVSLTPRQDAAIAALLETGKVVDAARRVKVHERTLRTWLDDPAFLAAYRRARGEVMAHSLGALQQATSEAVKTLRSAMKGRGKALAVSAARTVLEHAVRAAELVDHAERIEALERALNAEGRELPQ